MTENTPKIPSEILEQMIIARSIHSLSFFLKIKSYLSTSSYKKKSYFNDIKNQLIFNILNVVYNKWSRLPHIKEVKMLVEKLEEDEELRLLTNSMINRYYDEDTSAYNEEALILEAKDFITESRLIEAIALSQIDMVKGSYSNIVERVREAITISFDKDLGTSIKNSDEAVEKMEYVKNPKNVILSKWTTYDKVIGGFYPGEIACFAGVPGLGKCCIYSTEIEISINNETIKTKIGEMFTLFGKNKVGEHLPPDGLKVKTPDGFKTVLALIKTRFNPEWEVKTENHTATFADLHRVEVIENEDNIDAGRKWKFVKNLVEGDKLVTETGVEELISLRFNGNYSQMYDIQVEDNKCYYTNGFVSHNTLVLGNIAVAAMEQGKKVLFVSFETGVARLLTRFYSNMFEKNKKDLLVDMETLKKSIDTLKNNENIGDIILKEYGANTTCSNDLIALLNDLKMYKKWVPDMVVVDYILIMTTNDKKSTSDNPFKYYKSVTEELRNIAKGFNIPVITACQINRQGQGDNGGSKSLTTAKDIAESRGIFDTVDYFITLNQTPADKKAGKMRMFIEKNRNDENGVIANMKVNYEQMRVSE